MVQKKIFRPLIGQDGTRNSALNIFLLRLSTSAKKYLKKRRFRILNKHWRRIFDYQGSLIQGLFLLESQFKINPPPFILTKF